MIKYSLATLAAMVLTGSLMNGTATAQQDSATVPTTPPNIIVFLVDDLGWSDVGYNSGANGFYETPNVDQMAREGMTLNRFYPGGPNCAPTRACLMTGTYGPRTKIYQPGGKAKGKLQYMRWQVPTRGAAAATGGIESRVALAPSFTSVAELLNTKGYVTARIGKWHLGPDDQGFDISTEDGSPRRQKNGRPVIKKYYNDPHATDRMTTAAESFLESNTDTPFFLYFSLWDVHTPLVARKQLIEKYRKKWEQWPDKSKQWSPTYAAMIENMDQSLGRIRRKLNQLNLAENTLLIFASDNGGPGRHSCNLPLRGAKGSLYEGGIRSPAVAVWPGKIQPGSQSDEPITGVDLMPTLAELSQAKLSQEQPVDGRSMLPSLTGEQAEPQRAIFWHYPLYLSGSPGNRGWPGDNVLPVYGTERMVWRGVPSSAIMKGDWKLIYYYEYDRCELFNIKADPGEQHEQRQQHPKIARSLQQELMEWVQVTGADVPKTPNPKFRRN